MGCRSEHCLITAVNSSESRIKQMPMMNQDHRVHDRITSCYPVKELRHKAIKTRGRVKWHIKMIQEMSRPAKVLKMCRQLKMKGNRGRKKVGKKSGEERFCILGLAALRTFLLVLNGSIRIFNRELQVPESTRL